MNQNSQNHSEGISIMNEDIISQQLEHVNPLVVGIDAIQQTQYLADVDVNQIHEVVLPMEQFKLFEIDWSWDKLCINHSLTWIAAWKYKKLELFRLIDSQWVHCQSIKSQMFNYKLKFNHNSTLIAYAEFKEIHILELSDGNSWTLVQSIDTQQDLLDILFNHNSTIFAIISDDLIHLNEQINGLWTCTQQLVHQEMLSFCQFNHNSTLIGALSTRYDIILWHQDVNVSQQWIIRCAIQHCYIFHFQFNHNSSQIIGGGHSNDIIIWQLSNSKVLKQQCILRNQKEQVFQLIAHTRQHMFVSRSVNDYVIIWRIGINGKWKRTKQLDYKNVISLMLSPNSKNIIAIMNNKSIK